MLTILSIICIDFYNFKSPSYISRKYPKPVSKKKNVEDLGEI